jgi:chromosome segregation ATPase
MKKSDGDSLKIKLEEARGKLEKVEEEFDKQRAMLHSLDGQIVDLAGRRQNKLFLLEKAGEDRMVAIQGVKEEVAMAATEEIYKLEREISVLNQLHETAIKSKTAIEGGLKKKAKNVESARHEFWWAASRIELRKIESNKILLKAWLCSQLAMITQTFGNFLSTAFGSYAVGDLNSLRDEIYKEYGRRDE